MQYNPPCTIQFVHCTLRGVPNASSAGSCVTAVTLTCVTPALFRRLCPADLDAIPQSSGRIQSRWWWVVHQGPGSGRYQGLTLWLQSVTTWYCCLFWQNVRAKGSLRVQQQPLPPMPHVQMRWTSLQHLSADSSGLLRPHGNATLWLGCKHR